MFTDAQQSEIRVRSGGVDPVVLRTLLEGCGFNAAGYVQGNPDLSAAGIGAAAGVTHFLVHGFDERRHLPCGPLGEGFAALAGRPWPDRIYASKIAESLFFGQLRHPETAERLWQGAIPGLLEAVTSLGGTAFFIMGDSHAQHYCRAARSGETWLAPLPLTCLATAAADLERSTTPEANGPRLLRMIARVAETRPRWETPVLLKFGGIDAEFRWMLRRVRHNIAPLSDAEFNLNTERSLAAYGQFLDRLTDLVPADLVSLCAVFPSVLPDSIWSARFSAVHGTGPLGATKLAAALEGMQCPDLTTRNRFRAHYNAGLRAMAGKRAMGFIDDFTPLLGPGGVLAQNFAPHDPADFHLDWQASGPTLTRLLRQTLGLPWSDDLDPAPHHGAAVSITAPARMV